MIYMPLELLELREKLVVELLAIGRNSLQCKRTTSLSGMAEIMGISKETVVTLIGSLEKENYIVVNHAKIVIKRKTK